MMLPDTFLIERCALMGFVSIFRYSDIRTFLHTLWTGLKYPKFKNLTLHLTAIDWAALWFIYGPQNTWNRSRFIFYHVIIFMN